MRDVRCVLADQRPRATESGGKARELTNTAAGARKPAAKRKTTLTSLIEQGLELVFRRPLKRPEHRLVALPECRAGGGTFPGVGLLLHLLEQSNATVIVPGTRHWSIFLDHCGAAKASGNLVQDAWLAALAIESGCEWITTDRDYSRFPGLTWREPL